MRKPDLFIELTSECRMWQFHLQLRAVDTELHACFNAASDTFETVTLHGFTQVQKTTQVKAALGREQHRLVAQVVAHEILDDMLEGMLEGWVFGEHNSRRALQGFVPSIYRDGPLDIPTLRRLESAHSIGIWHIYLSPLDHFIDHSIYHSIDRSIYLSIDRYRSIY